MFAEARRGTLTALFIAALGFPAAAQAGTVTYNDAQGLRYLAGPNEVNNAEIYDASGEDGPPGYVLSDSAGITAGPGCSSLGPGRAACDFSTRRVTVALGNRHDALDLGSLGQGFEVSVDLGSGPDQMFGSQSGDLLDGGSGRDYIPGGEGNDTLIGGPGFDALFGGKGRDRIKARDGRRDQVINCGHGHDPGAAIDRRLDPAPVSC